MKNTVSYCHPANKNIRFAQYEDCEIPLWAVDVRREEKLIEIIGNEFDSPRLVEITD